MKTARQLKDLIRNLSKKTGVDSQILIRQYMMDHLLERISQTRLRTETGVNDSMIAKLLRCQIGISINDSTTEGRGGRSYMPYAITEQ